MNYLSEAFQKLEDILDEDVFDLDKDGLEDLRDFQDESEEETIDVYDPDAETEEDLEDSYIGKVILDCSVCHTDIYKDKEDVIIDEETQLANVGEECPYCFSIDGFKVIGEVKPFVETEFETEDDVEVEVDGEEVEEEEEEDEEKNESFKRHKKIVESISRRNRRLKESNFNKVNEGIFGNKGNSNDNYKFFLVVNKPGSDGWKVDSYASGMKTSRTKLKKRAEEYSDAHDGNITTKIVSESDAKKIDKNWKDHAKDLDKDKKYNIEESISIRNGKSLTEAPIYGLEPRYDARKSFYGKAQVDTGDKGDKNKLYSYGTLVAEIKDGKPVVYGTYSQTTLRHIKDWLKQNGFRADTSKQIVADYGVKDEACSGRKSRKSMREGWRGTPVKMVSHGSWSDPDLVWNDGEKEYTFNYWDIEDAMWSMFLEETGHDDSESNDPKVEAEFDEFVQNNYEDYLGDVVFGGYFDEGSTDWHDRYRRESLNKKPRKARKMKESIEDITIDTGDQEITVSAKEKEDVETDGEMIAPISDETKEEIETHSEETEE